MAKLVKVDPRARVIDVKKMKKTASVHPSVVFGHQTFGVQPMANSLLDLGRWVASDGIDAPGEHRAARDLFLGLPPRLSAGSEGLERPPSEEALDTAKRLAMELDCGVLPVQGPPGSGKSYSGARMICELVRDGQRVGVTATSHKVIRNLLDKVVIAAEEEGLALTCVQKPKRRSEQQPAGIIETTSPATLLAALDANEAQVGGGTTFLWSSERFTNSVDVLFVDEAGQMSLANVLAVAQAAKSVVLLGDPQQLEQPQQGSHPEGTEVSALEHVLGDHDTIPPERGLFLPETWRLHPLLTEFTSEVFYEGLLESRAGMELQDLESSSAIRAPGLWFRPVEHSGNQSSSAEEVEVVRRLVNDLLSSGSRWTNAQRASRELRLKDILVVAPYNAQVSLLSAALGADARVGTVDKFQGQEAPIVIYSLTSSSPEEAPRGMEFLYSPNRLNVATSRAKVACVLVGNPRLFEPECRTPRQMKLANAFCRYLEMAKEVNV